MPFAESISGPVLRIPLRPAVTVVRETTLAEAARRMDQAGVGSLVVVDGDEPVGIVTDRDLAVRAIARQVPHDARIDAVMTCGVVTVPHDAGNAEILRLFRSHAVRRVPVVEGGSLIGVIALDDLLAALPDSGVDVRELAGVVREELRHPRHEAGLPMLAADSAPRPLSLARGQARVGDQLVIHLQTGHRRFREGEILAVGSPSGDPPFRVRWSDDGRTTFIYPGRATPKFATLPRIAPHGDVWPRRRRCRRGSTG